MPQENLTNNQKYQNMNQENGFKNKNEQEIKVNQKKDDEQEVEFKDAPTEPYNRKENEESYQGSEKFYTTCVAEIEENRFSPNLTEAKAELKSDIAKILSQVESWSKEEFTVDEIELLKETLLSLKNELEQIIKYFDQEHPGELKNIPRLHKIIDQIRQCIFNLYIQNVDKQFKELSNLIKL